MLLYSQVPKMSDKPHKYLLWVSITPGDNEHHGLFFPWYSGINPRISNWSLTGNYLFFPEWKSFRTGKGSGGGKKGKTGDGGTPAPPFLFFSGENPTEAFYYSLGFKVIVTSP